MSNKQASPELTLADLSKWAWVAGIIDGEGSFIFTKRKCKTGGCFSSAITIGMTDLDVLQRMDFLLKGNLNGPYKYGPSHYKEFWRFSISTNSNVISVIEHIYYFLCERRRDKCDEIIKAYESHYSKKVNLINYGSHLSELDPGALEIVHNSYCAGILEGEGSIIPHNHKKSGCATVRLVSTDKDIVDRFKTYLDLGKCNGPYKIGPNKKVQWMWSVEDRDGVFKTLDKLKPFLLSRRYSACLTLEESILKYLKYTRCAKHRHSKSTGGCVKCKDLRNKFINRVSYE